MLRWLRRADRRPLVTDAHIAHALGDADRRNGHNYWAACETCGCDLVAYLSRRKKVDTEVVVCCEQIGRAHPLWTPVHPGNPNQLKWLIFDPLMSTLEP